MDDPKPCRPWWRKKRWRAAAAVAFLSAYPPSFFPACWALMRLDPNARPGDVPRWEALTWAYRPAAEAVIAAPPGVQRAVARAVEAGSPAGCRFRVDTMMVLSVRPTADPALPYMIQVW